MDQIELKVDRRETLGKKVRFLRREGITPVHLFGHGIESEALQCETARLQQVLAEAGHTKLINLQLANEKKPRTAVVREIQPGIRPGELLHVDFYQVKMEVAVKIEAPIVLVGEAPVLESKENTVLQELDTLTVECLPAQIPESISIDITPLTEPDQALRVKDIELDDEITIINDPEVVLVRSARRRVEVAEEVVVAEEAEEVEGAAEAEAAPAPGEESKEE